MAADQDCCALGAEVADVTVETRVDYRGLEGVQPGFVLHAAGDLRLDEGVAVWVVQVVEIDGVAMSTNTLLGRDALAGIHIEVDTLAQPLVGRSKDAISLAALRARAVVAAV